MENRKIITEMIWVAVILFLLMPINIVYKYIVLQNLTYLRMATQVLFYSVMILIIFFVVKKVENQKIESIGLYTNDLTIQLLIGIGLFAILSILPIGALLFGAEQNVLNSNLPNIFILICYTVIDILFVGFGEEIVFRGFFLERMKRVFNSSIWAVLISSILFGLWHYPANQSIPQVIMATLLGVFFSVCKLKIKKCNIISLAIAHGLNNAFLLWLGFFLL